MDAASSLVVVLKSQDVTPLDHSLDMDTNRTNPNKGQYTGECNRTVCKEPLAEWYNHSTRKYYCYQCAMLINDANRKDAKELFGHDLCTQGEDTN